MFSTRKIVLGVAGSAIIVGSGLGVAGLAGAQTPSPSPTPGQMQTWQRGGGYGRMAANPNAGLRNGSGYGAVENAEYLAGKLGVSQESVTAAMASYHSTNRAQVRGRDLTEAQQATAHSELARFLARELNVSEPTVLAALDAMDEVRRAERTAALKANLDAAVSSGRLTRSQADAILADHEAGTRVGGMGAGFRGGPRR